MKVHVSIYDEKHKKLLESSPKFDEIIQLDGKTIELPQEDFLVYSIFKEQKPYPGFDCYSALKDKLPSRIERFHDYLDLSNTITAKFNSATFQKEITEEVGVGAALSVIGKIHSLTEADWNIINESRHKDLDFYVSSDGNNIIEVECKGTFSDPDIKTTKVSSKKRDIESKKNYQRIEQDNKNLLYGIITSYINDASKMAHCRILDPKSNSIYGDPQKIRILSRLFFYLNELNSISKSHFLIALANRIRDLMHIDRNFYQFDKVPLIKANGEPFSFPVSFEYNKPRIKEYDGFGDVTKIKENSFLFYGLCDDIINILISQDFEKLSELSFSPKTIKTSIDTKLSKKEIDHDVYFHKISPGYGWTRLYGTAHKTSAGLIFGIFHHEDH